MNVLKSTSFLLFSIAFTWSSYGTTTLSAKEVKVQAAKQRKITLEQARTMVKQMMLITKITIDEATITNMQFRKEGYRPWQRWTREMGK
jgi:hypothetical protein